MLVGRTVGGFRVERELGAGGMGTVYFATAETAAFGLERGAPAALKVIHPHLVASDDARGRFRREAVVGERVRSENVARTLGALLLDVDGASFPCIVMEYVDGQTLRALLAELGQVPEELCRHVAIDIARGLAAIHAAGAMHRDLKPENALITKRHVVKITDLGIARFLEDPEQLSSSGAFVGSLRYAAPEQIRPAGRPVDGRADLYGLGTLLFELAAGVPAFDGADAGEIIDRQLHAAPRRLASVNQQVSPFFEEVVAKLLAKSRDERFDSAATLLDVLSEGERSAWWRRRSGEILESTKRPLRRARVPRETQLYGREREMSLLQAAYERAAAGDGSALLLEGEAGVGKSRLVEEFLGRIAADDADQLCGSYPPGGAASATGALAEALLERFGADAVETRLAELLGSARALAAPFAAHVKGEPGGTLTQQGLHSAFVLTARALAESQPLVWVVDDLHFAPEEGLALFAALALAVRGKRILLVGTSRPGLPDRWRGELSRSGDATFVPVPRLSRADLAHLLAEALPRGAATEALVEQIYLRSDANPFFALEMVRGLREGSYVTQTKSGEWTTTRDVSELRVPPRIRDLLSARLSVLDDEERGLLDVAMCCGFEFEPALVADALGMARIPALRRFAQMERRNGIVRAAGSRFVFDHHQIWELLSDLLPDALESEYHAAIGRTLEAREGAALRDPAELPGALAADLCDHWLWAGDDDRARRYIGPALTHLEGRNANAAALDLAGRALARQGLLAGAERVRVLTRRAVRFATVGRRDEERAALKEALDLATEDAVRSTILEKTGTSLLLSGRTDDARGVLLESVRLAERSGDLESLAAAHGDLGNVHMTAGRLDEAEAAYRTSRDIAVRAGTRRVEMNAVGNLGNVAHVREDLALAEACFRESLAIALEIGDARSQTSMYLNLGNLVRDLGRFEEAIDLRRSAIAIARRVGNRPLESQCLGNLAITFEDLGRWSEAIDAFESGAEIARQIGSRPQIAIIALNRGAAAAMLGDHDESRRLLDLATQMHREMGVPQREAYSILYAALAAWRRGDLDAAASLCDEVEARRDALPSPADSVARLLAAARVADARGRRDTSRALIDEAVGVAGPAEGSAAALVAHAWRARLTRDSGAALAALERLEPRLSVLDHMDVRWSLWRATDDVRHLAEAWRLLALQREHAPPRHRGTMVDDVAPHREIADAARRSGLV